MYLQVCGDKWGKVCDIQSKGIVKNLLSINIILCKECTFSQYIKLVKSDTVLKPRKGAFISKL